MSVSCINIKAGVFCGILSLFGAGHLHAEPLEAVDPTLRETFAAVGHLQGPGFRMSRGCSATLVAPHLAVTAAHCLTGALWNNEKQQFRAGLSGETHVARGTYRKVTLHPSYSTRKGKARLPYDIAIVHLTAPIPRESVRPLTLLPPDAMPPRFATLLGYRHDAPGVLAGREGCASIFVPNSQMHRYGCEVVSGISGGAVVAETPDGPALAAIIVARHGENGDALAVPVNNWLREKLRQYQHFEPSDR